MVRDDTHVDKENRRRPFTFVIHARFCHRAVTVAGEDILIFDYKNIYIYINKKARLEQSISRSIF